MRRARAAAVAASAFAFAACAEAPLRSEPTAAAPLRGTWQASYRTCDNRSVFPSSPHTAFDEHHLPRPAELVTFRDDGAVWSGPGAVDRGGFRYEPQSVDATQRWRVARINGDRVLVVVERAPGAEREWVVRVEAARANSLLITLVDGDDSCRERAMRLPDTLDHDDVLMAIAASGVRRVLQTCDHVDGVPFDLALSIAPDGRLLRAAPTAPSARATCFAEALREVRFPATTRGAETTLSLQAPR